MIISNAYKSVGFIAALYLFALPFIQSLFRLPDLLLTSLVTSRLYRLRACRKQASAEPPPIENSSYFKWMLCICTAMVSALLLLLPTSVLAAGSAAAADVAAQATTSSVLLLVLFVLLAIGISFVCSLAESALLTMTPSYIADVQERNPNKALMLKRLKVDNIDRSVACRYFDFKYGSAYGWLYWRWGTSDDCLW